MTQNTAIHLIKSLSGAEKRFFKLYAKRQSVDRCYLDLFALIDKTVHPEQQAIFEAFQKKHPSVSVHNTARYLVKVLTDCLVQLKTEKDPFFQQLHGIMQVQVLQERSLPGEAARQLGRIRDKAQRLQQQVIEYLTWRYELNFAADGNFGGIHDQQLVDMQMKARNVLKSINHIQDHHSLFELLKYRLVNAGRISSEENKKQLNDLMLSEMGLVAGRSGKSFAAHKLHLLFQSFFFTDIGDYHSALKTFASLNQLFERHLELLEHPPVDYLSTLNGILDNLHMLEQYSQMAFYMDKALQLDQPAYPGYFRYRVRKTVAVYQLVSLITRQQYQEATALVSTELLEAYNMVDEEKQWELYFYYSLAWFRMGNWKKAHQQIAAVSQRQQPHPRWLVCKAIRLLNIIVHYEKGDADYIEYELRSYKRFFGKEQQLKSESLLFRFMKLCPAPGRAKMQETRLRSMTHALQGLQKDQYERQLLKYFDITTWVAQKLGK
jgi:hypothetical protein